MDNSSIKKLALAAGGVVLFAFLLNNLSAVGTVLSTLWSLIFPFVLGYIVAFLLNLPMRFIENKLFRGRGGKLRRPVSFVASLLLVLGAIALVVGLAGPQLWKTVVQLSASMPGYIKSIEKSLQPYFEYIPAVQEWLQNLNVDWADLVKQISGLLSSGAGSFFTSAISVATSIAGGLFSLFIGIVFACYLLLDKEHLTAQFKGLLKAYLPEKVYEKTVDIATLTSHTFANFISGQCLEAVLLTVVYFLILSVGGFDYALLIAVVVGFFSLVPMVGAYIGCFVGVFLLWVSMGFWRALAFVIIMVIVQQVEGNFIYPHIIGSSVGLPPVWMLLAVTVGGSLAGIFGMMIFIPLFSVIYTLVHRNAKARLAKKGIENPVEEWSATRPPKKKHHFGRKAKAGAGAEGEAPDAAKTANAAAAPNETAPGEDSFDKDAGEKL